VIEWAYCDNLNSGCEYYLFVQQFTSLDDLRLKDTLTARDKVQGFIQACRQETFGGSHELAYVGTYPLTAQDFPAPIAGKSRGPKLPNGDCRDGDSDLMLVTKRVSDESRRSAALHYRRPFLALKPLRVPRFGYFCFASSGTFFFTFSTFGIATFTT
jgi:hypothetical protein